MGEGQQGGFWSPYECGPRPIGVSPEEVSEMVTDDSQGVSPEELTETERPVEEMLEEPSA